jgi:hypothetical protein
MRRSQHSATILRRRAGHAEAFGRRRLRWNWAWLASWLSRTARPLRGRRSDANAKARFCIAAQLPRLAVIACPRVRRPCSTTNFDPVTVPALPRNDSRRCMMGNSSRLGAPSKLGLLVAGSPIAAARQAQSEPPGLWRSASAQAWRASNAVSHRAMITRAAIA